MKRVIILGCSGSIGRSALDVARAFPDSIRIVGLSAHSNADALAAAGREFGVGSLCLGRADPSFPLAGTDGLSRLVRETEADLVLNAISGAAGLRSSLDALESGKDLALANKETMVCAGPLARRTAAASGRRILPVDSEHSAVFHLMEAFGRTVAEIVLTASGGPFWDRPASDFDRIGPEDALRHPTWSMGTKITIDSASMANKGLEVIEAHELFGVGYDSIKVVVHRESKIHSLIRSVDGSLYAQISKPDMRLPIQNALLWPESRPSPTAALDLAGQAFSFHAPDAEKFPLLPLAYRAGREGGLAPLAYNAANEVAVQAFLSGAIRFTDIARVVESCIGACPGGPAEDYSAALAADGAARAAARAFIGKEIAP